MNAATPVSPPSRAKPVTPAPPAALPAPIQPPPHPGPDLLAEGLIPFQTVDYSVKGYHLDATVPADNVVDVAVQLDRKGLSLDTITGVDWLAQAQMEVLYDYFHISTGLRVVVRARIPRENPEIPTISSVFPGANWHEREAHDFFGIVFLGHPNLPPFLLPEDATYHPLRKDFKA